MLSFLRRLWNIIKANLNWLLSRFEDPVKQIDITLEDMRAQFEEAKRHVARAMVDEKRLERAYHTELEKAQAWEQRALVAVRAGDEELAKQALMRKREHSKYAEELEQSWLKQKDATEKLREGLRQLGEKIEEARRKRSILLARHRRVEAQQTLQRAMGTMTDESALEAFARIEERIEEMEAQAEAQVMLEGGEAATLEKRFAELEVSAEESAIEEELEALRARVAEERRLPVTPQTTEQTVELRDEQQ